MSKPGSPISKDEILEFLRRRSTINQTTKCWVWNGEVRGGYGVVNKGTRANLFTGERSAHRVACVLNYGPLNDLVARHTCNQKLCCNPDHLIPGTQAQNAGDRKQPLEEMTLAALINRQNRLLDQLGLIEAELHRRGN